MATVELAIYDLTMGMAKQMAAPLAGLLDGKSVEMKEEYPPFSRGELIQKLG